MYEYNCSASRAAPRVVAATSQLREQGAVVHDHLKMGFDEHGPTLDNAKVKTQLGLPDQNK